MSDNTASIQRHRLLAWLKQNGSISTTEARHKLDILAPAARIHELRHDKGLNIVTTDDYGENPGGTMHPVARYILRPGKYQSGRKGGYHARQN